MHKEDDLQMAVAKYLDLKGVLWCHVANERKSSIIAGRRLKMKGVKSGVPDVLIFNRSEDYIGLAIELKIKPNNVTKSQKAWIDNLYKKGWYSIVCYSIDEVIEIVDEYMKWAHSD